MKSTAEFNSTFDQQVLLARKCNRCIRDLQANTIRWKYRNKNQFKRMRKKRRKRTKKERSVSQSLGRKQPLPFIDLPHQSHMVLWMWTRQCHMTCMSYAPVFNTSDVRWRRRAVGITPCCLLVYNTSVPTLAGRFAPWPFRQQLLCLIRHHLRHRHPCYVTRLTR